LRQTLQKELGPFPLRNFWGPGASIESSRWIAAAAKRVLDRYRSRLTLVYVPHLDYDFQRFGPDDPRSEAAFVEVDDLVGDLLDFFADRQIEPVLVGEYGIEAVDFPVAINRHLREAGFLTVRDERGRDMIDFANSRAFAIADHQIAHIYVQAPADLSAVMELCSDVPGVADAFAREKQIMADIGHDRSGDLVLVARPGAWFTYDFWLEDGRAPDFARTVDIHRKPGYDPRELFFDPALLSPKLSVGLRLLRQSLGFRTLMDVIPLDARVVRGSHGRTEIARDRMPVLLGDFEDILPEELPVTAVHRLVVEKLTGSS
jgi:predicted AlkP superfamily pyrophosphatase or phosphodiesterase